MNNGLLGVLNLDLIKKIKSYYLKSVLTPISAFVLTIIHSVLVLGTLGLINGSKIAEGSETSYWVMMGGVLASSSIPEAIAASVVVWPVSIAIVPGMVKVQTEKDNSDILGNIGLVFAFILPPLTWVISGIGYHKAKYFKNKNASALNKYALIFSGLVFIALLITYMLTINL